MFVAVAGQGYLEFLRSIGFQTFGNVIDESYDQEPDNIKRWTMAMNQVELLCSKDPADVISQVQEIVDHNRQLMLTTNWYGQLAQYFIKELDLLLGPAQIVAG